MSFKVSNIDAKKRDWTLTPLVTEVSPRESKTSNIEDYPSLTPPSAFKAGEYLLVAMPKAQVDKKLQDDPKEQLESTLLERFNEAIEGKEEYHQNVLVKSRDEFESEYTPSCHGASIGVIPDFLKEAYDKRVGSGMEKKVDTILEESAKLTGKDKLAVHDVIELLGNYTEILKLCAQRKIANEILGIPDSLEGLGLDANQIKLMESMSKSILENYSIIKDYVSPDYEGDKVFKDPEVATMILRDLNINEGFTSFINNESSAKSSNTKILHSLCTEHLGELVKDYQTRVQANLKIFEQKMVESIDEAKMLVTNAAFMKEIAKFKEIASVSEDMNSYLEGRWATSCINIWLGNIRETVSSSVPWSRDEDTRKVVFKEPKEIESIALEIDSAKKLTLEQLAIFDKIFDNSNATDLTRNAIDKDYSIGKSIEYKYRQAWLYLVEEFTGSEVPNLEQSKKMVEQFRYQKNYLDTLVTVLSDQNSFKEYKLEVAKSTSSILLEKHSSFVKQLVQDYHSSPETGVEGFIEKFDMQIASLFYCAKELLPEQEHGKLESALAKSKDSYLATLLEISEDANSLNNRTVLKAEIEKREKVVGDSDPKENQKLFSGLKVDEDGLIREPLAKVLETVFKNNSHVILGDGGHIDPSIQNAITLATQKFARNYSGTKSAISLELPHTYQPAINEALKGDGNVHGVAYDMLSKAYSAEYKIDLTVSRLKNAQGKVGVIAHDTDRKDSEGKDLPFSEVNQKWVDTILETAKEEGYERLLIVGGALHTINPKGRGEITEKKDFDELFEETSNIKPFYIHLVSDAKLMPGIVPGDSKLYSALTKSFNIENNINDTPDLLVSFGHVSQVARFDEINNSPLFIAKRIEEQNVIDAVDRKLLLVAAQLKRSQREQVAHLGKQVFALASTISYRQYDSALLKSQNINKALIQTLTRDIKQLTEKKKLEGGGLDIGQLAKKYDEILDTMRKVTEEIEKLNAVK